LVHLQSFGPFLFQGVMRNGGFCLRNGVSGVQEVCKSHIPIWSLTMRDYQKTSLLGFAVLAIAVLGNIFLFHRAFQNIAATEQWVSHTNAVRAEIYAVESGMKDAQRGARGFIISHQEQALTPYNNGLRSTQEHFDLLSSLTSDNPRQQIRVEHLKPDLDRLFDLLQREVALVKAGRAKAAADFVVAGTANPQVDAISAILTEMVDEENQLLKQREAATARDKSLAFAALIFAAVCTLLLLAGIFMIVFRQARQRHRAAEALARMGRKLMEAQEEERARIARELHDDIVQRIALLAVQLRECTERLPNVVSELHCYVPQAPQRLMEIGNDIQSLSHRLHSSKLEYVGIIAAVNSFCKELSEQKRIEIDFNHTELPRSVPKEISLCLFRVLQEALQNAVKHSGVQRFRVELRSESGEIHLSVSDSGVGFDPAAAISGQGLGLISMRERLSLVNGKLSIESEAGRGTTVSARVPLKGEESVRARVS
jgi:signal transduction histidine kinase